MKLALVALVALVGCKDKASPPVARGSAAVPTTLPATAPKAGAIAPTVTNSVTFVTPSNAKWWGEMNFACYRAVTSLSGTKSAGEAFENISPLVAPAMKAANVDLGRDLAAIGGFDCGDTPCFYVAAHLTAPEKVKDALGILAPQAPPKEVSPGHYVIETPGANGTRTMHIRVVPLDWTAKPGNDAWSQQVGAATHIVFIVGVDGQNKDIDPMLLVGDPTTAQKRIVEVESILSNTRNRCVIADVGERDFQPGFRLTRGRVALAVPEAGETKDAVMTLMGSRKTLDLEVDLALAPAATEANASAWIAMGKTYLAGIGESVKGQFAGQGELMQIYFDMISLVGVKGFEHALDKDSLRLSWRTNRIPEADLTRISAQLEQLTGPAAP